MTRIQLNKIFFLVCFWICCTIFIVTYEAVTVDFESTINTSNYNFLRILMSAVIVTIIGSAALGSLEVLVFSRFLRRKAFGLSMLIKTAVYMVFIIVFTSIVVIYSFSAELSAGFFSQEVLNIYRENFLFSPKVLMSIIYWGAACLMGIFILQTSEKFGHGVLINFILGKYHKPKEEDRIFMFMDLKSSTTYAEKLGHIKYSQFIQDCFFDINDIVVKYKAGIYQYVGDEVVLEWDIYQGIKNGNCINTYFAFDNLLKSKSGYYEQKYGVVPEFKAGMNLGKVTVAEVGVLKKELAYHGDVINTASRIQNKCNDLQKNILLSETTKKHLEKQSNFIFPLIGNFQLKGKMEPVTIYEAIPA